MPDPKNYIIRLTDEDVDTIKSMPIGQTHTIEDATVEGILGQIVDPSDRDIDFES